MPVATTTPHLHLPVPLGVLSEWQRTTRDHPLLNKGKDEPLPEHAEVVIVGSGMCGAVLANTLLKSESSNKPKSVVVLEAREICSGASGRNAGHCRPDPHRGFPNFSKLHGGEEARKICESEAEVLKRVDAYITEHNVECEWTPRKTFDACITEEFSTYSAQALEQLRKSGGTDPVDVLRDEAAQKATRVNGAVASYGWPAATLNPAQLTLSIHVENSSYPEYSLFSWSPVTSVIESGSGSGESGKWEVRTSRGNVLADKVIFATNAYSQAVVPELEGLITPMRAQAIKLSAAPAGQEAFPRLEASYSLRYLLQHFYSVACRPDNSIILGTSRGWKGMPPTLYQSLINTVDDSAPSDFITENAVKSFASIFPHGGWSIEGGESGKGQGVEYAWAGIIGMTPDAIPFIGEIPGKAGQYVAAGYNGHGMARIFLAAPALANFILSGEWDEAMPKSFIVTPERLEKLRRKVKGEEDIKGVEDSLEKATI